MQLATVLGGYELQDSQVKFKLPPVCVGVAAQPFLVMGLVCHGPKKDDNNTRNSKVDLGKQAQSDKYTDIKDQLSKLDQNNKQLKLTKNKSKQNLQTHPITPQQSKGPLVKNILFKQQFQLGEMDGELETIVSKDFTFSYQCNVEKFDESKTEFQYFQIPYLQIQVPQDSSVSKYASTLAVELYGDQYFSRKLLKRDSVQQNKFVSLSTINAHFTIDYTPVVKIVAAMYDAGVHTVFVTLAQFRVNNLAQFQPLTPNILQIQSPLINFKQQFTDYVQLVQKLQKVTRSYGTEDEKIKSALRHSIQIGMEESNFPGVNYCGDGLLQEMKNYFDESSLFSSDHHYKYVVMQLEEKGVHVANKLTAKQMSTSNLQNKNIDELGIVDESQKLFVMISLQLSCRIKLANAELGTPLQVYGQYKSSMDIDVMCSPTCKNSNTNLLLAFGNNQEKLKYQQCEFTKFQDCYDVNANFVNESQVVVRSQPVSKIRTLSQVLQLNVFQFKEQKYYKLVDINSLKHIAISEVNSNQIIESDEVTIKEQGVEITLFTHKVAVKKQQQKLLRDIEKIVKTYKIECRGMSCQNGTAGDMEKQGNLEFQVKQLTKKSLIIGEAEFFVIKKKYILTMADCTELPPQYDDYVKILGPQQQQFISEEVQADHYPVVSRTIFQSQKKFEEIGFVETYFQIKQVFEVNKQQVIVTESEIQQMRYKWSKKERIPYKDTPKSFLELSAKMDYSKEFISSSAQTDVAYVPEATTGWRVDEDQNLVNPANEVIAKISELKVNGEQLKIEKSAVHKIEVCQDGTMVFNAKPVANISQITANGRQIASVEQIAKGNKYVIGANLTLVDTEKNQIVGSLKDMKINNQPCLEGITLTKDNFHNFVISQDGILLGPNDEKICNIRKLEISGKPVVDSEALDCKPTIRPSGQIVAFGRDFGHISDVFTKDGKSQFVNDMTSTREMQQFWFDKQGNLMSPDNKVLANISEFCNLSQSQKEMLKTAFSAQLNNEQKMQEIHQLDKKDQTPMFSINYDQHLLHNGVKIADLSNAHISGRSIKFSYKDKINCNGDILQNGKVVGNLQHVKDCGSQQPVICQYILPQNSNYLYCKDKHLYMNSGEDFGSLEQIEKKFTILSEEEWNTLLISPSGTIVSQKGDLLLNIETKPPCYYFNIKGELINEKQKRVSLQQDIYCNKRKIFQHQRIINLVMVYFTQSGDCIDQSGNVIGNIYTFTDANGECLVRPSPQRYQINAKGEVIDKQNKDSVICRVSDLRIPNIKQVSNLIQCRFRIVDQFLIDPCNKILGNIAEYSSVKLEVKHKFWHIDPIGLLFNVLGEQICNINDCYADNKKIQIQTANLFQDYKIFQDGNVCNIYTNQLICNLRQLQNSSKQILVQEQYLPQVTAKNILLGCTHIMQNGQPIAKIIDTKVMGKSLEKETENEVAVIATDGSIVTESNRFLGNLYDAYVTNQPIAPQLKFKNCWCVKQNTSMFDPLQRRFESQKLNALSPFHLAQLFFRDEKVMLYTQEILNLVDVVNGTKAKFYYFDRTKNLFSPNGISVAVNRDLFINGKCIAETNQKLGSNQLQDQFKNVILNKRIVENNVVYNEIGEILEVMQQGEEAKAVVQSAPISFIKPSTASSTADFEINQDDDRKFTMKKMTLRQILVNNRAKDDQPPASVQSPVIQQLQQAAVQQQQPSFSMQPKTASSLFQSQVNSVQPQQTAQTGPTFQCNSQKTLQSVINDNKAEASSVLNTNNAQDEIDDMNLKRKKMSLKELLAREKQKQK